MISTAKPNACKGPSGMSAAFSLQESRLAVQSHRPFKYREESTCDREGVRRRPGACRPSGPRTSNTRLRGSFPTPATCFRWRKGSGGMKVDQTKRLKALEQENAWLTRLPTGAKLEKAILKEAAKGNF